MIFLTSSTWYHYCYLQHLPCPCKSNPWIDWEMLMTKVVISVELDEWKPSGSYHSFSSSSHQPSFRLLGGSGIIIHFDVWWIWLCLALVYACTSFCLANSPGNPANSPATTVRTDILLEHRYDWWFIFIHFYCLTEFRSKIRIHQTRVWALFLLSHISESLFFVLWFLLDFIQDFVFDTASNVDIYHPDVVPDLTLNFILSYDRR